MNEVEFVALSRTLLTGDLVYFYDREPLELREPLAPPGPAAGAPGVVAAGIVLRFVDPAKPTLVFRNAESRVPGLRIDFFQDALYATQPAIRAQWFALHRRDSNAPPQGLREWLSYLEQMIGRPLDGDTPLFEAYAEGLFGRRYPEPGAPVDLSAWVDHHLGLLALQLPGCRRTPEHFAVWEGYHARVSS